MSPVGVFCLFVGYVFYQMGEKIACYLMPNIIAESSL